MLTQRLKLLPAAIFLILIAFYLLPDAGSWLAVNPSGSTVSQKYDVIILLCGERDGRIETALTAYQENLAPQIIVSGGPIYVSGKSEAYFVGQILVKLGVPQKAILIEPNSASTWENALFSKKLMINKGFHSALVVTSDYHMRRACAIFRFVFHQAGFRVGYLPAPSDRFNPYQWWTSQSSIVLVIKEYAKMIYNFCLHRFTIADLIEKNYNMR
ncbi:Hypothetical protein LUCI_0563 [Lucifera butyrica]|uniref:DUF218 domain-containing protein n=1 Tax=Lucifera butyrica TaxID=1351585 RepID=A0A498R1M8_9FIRM|nr:YdcF family protein [Lucifera butyrica]VBB05354.1 Hypothetical protein LUCI_0563 [Lucifera butyrica]